MAYSVSPTANINLEKTYSSGEAPVALGTEVVGSDGATYQLVKFQAGKDKGKVYVIGDDFELTDGLTTTGTSAAPLGLGVPQVALDAPDAGVTFAFGFVAIKGAFKLFDTLQPAADVELFTTATAGILNSNTAGAKRLEGVKFTEAAVGASELRNAFSHLPLGVSTDA
jgi:hypothetical protein